MENKRLSGELGTTMDTMSRMLNEFSLMFAGGAGSDLDKDKLRHMFQKHEAIVNAEAAAEGAALDGVTTPEDTPVVESAEITGTDEAVNS